MGESLKPGDRIGKYRIIERIGEGGMGVVYKAKQLSMNREVALKVLSFKKEKIDPMLRKRFVNEARTAGKLNHENIIHVYDVARHGETFYFSMELVDGDTVGDLLKKKETFDVITSLTIAKGVLKALIAAGKLGIIHRDIKPDNIIITRDGITKVSDLGLAKRADLDKGGSITQEGVVMGTPHYMSPEQGRGEKLDGRSDVYSLGATLFHMLTGRTPFMGKSSYAIIAEVIKGNFPYPSDVEPSIPLTVSDTVVKMMAFSPDERFKSPKEVIKEIERIEDEATDKTMIEGIPAAEKKKLLWWWAGIGSAVLLGILIPVLLILFAANGDENGQGTGPEGGKPVVPPPIDPGQENNNVTETEKPFVFIYGNLSEREGKRTRVLYDFSYNSQLDDWFPDMYWRRKIIQAQAREVIKDLKDINDSSKMDLLRQYRLKYMMRPAQWDIIGGSLVNKSQSEVEGFVNKLTWVDDVECEISLEIKRARYPSLILSFMNDQAGNGLSFNIGRFTRSEQSMFIVSGRGKRKLAKPLNIPFSIETGTVYTIRFMKKNKTVKFWCEKGQSITAAEPLFETEVEGCRSGNVTLWSNLGLYKFYRVQLEGNLIPFNKTGWFIHSGQWIPEEDMYHATGYNDTEAVLRYGGLTPGKEFLIGITDCRKLSADAKILYSIPLTVTPRISRGRLYFGIHGNHIVVASLTPALSERRMRPEKEKGGRNTGGRFNGDEQRRRRREELINRLTGEMKYSLIKEGSVPDTDEIILSVDFADDGISFNVNGDLFFKDIKHVEYAKKSSIEILTNTKVKIKRISAAHRK
ncbi:serine/threonine protein kinase [Planctomycetota bacterium]